MIRVLRAALLAFLAGAFLLPTEAAYSLVFYLCVLPPLLFGWRRLPPVSPATWLALALIAWSALTLVWGEDWRHRSLGFALSAGWTAAFVVTLAAALKGRRARRRVGTALVWLGTSNAAFVLLTGLPALLRGDRLLGWGMTRHPVLGGSVVAVAFLTALWRALSECRGRRAHYAATGLMGCFVLAMQSRGALLGAAGAALLLLAAGRWRARAGAGCLAVLAVLLLPGGMRQRVEALVLARGASHRFEIWRAAWAAIMERPLFGWGLAANLPVSPTGFPHSLYLSLLFYGGVVGLVLFGGLAGLVTWRLARGWRRPDGPWMAALWANGVLAGLTDLGQITKGPSEMWVIIWLPAMLALSRE